MDAQTRDPSDADRSVEFYTRSVTVKEPDGDDEATRIEVPVSGLAEDRDGDKLADGAIDALVQQVNDGGVPMFPNHGYDADNGVPQAYRFEDIMGGWVAAEREGDVVTATAELREGHPSAEAVRDLFAQDLPVGFSIGFGWGEGDAEDRDAGGLRFHDIDLMEISPVGIQSHPDASTTGGMKVASALAEAGVDASSLDEQALARALTETMNGKNTDGGVTSAVKELSDEQLEQILAVIDGHFEALAEDAVDVYESADDAEAFRSDLMGVMDAHSEALRSDLMEVDANGDESDGDDEGEETDESGMDGDEEDGEESDEYDGDDDEEDDKVAELEDTIEELRAEMEAMKTETAESAERKGGIVTTEDGDTDEADDADTDSEESTTSGERDFAKNVV